MKGVEGQMDEEMDKQNRKQLENSWCE